MSASAIAWVLTSVGIILANLPFLTKRLAGFFRVSSTHGDKPATWAGVEFLLNYALWIGLGKWLEARQGPAHQQAWEFYAVTAALFAVFAFPGFSRRYFWGKGVF